MRHLAFIFIILLLTASCGTIPQHETDDLTTFILVRHAERVDDSRDSDLSEIGYLRAAKLDSMLAEIPFSAAYTTSYIRTRETIRPLVNRNNLELIEYETDQISELFPIWLEKHRGGYILISAHSNTIPNITNIISGKTYFPGDLDSSDFSNLMIITVGSDSRRSKITHIRF